ncbi:MAG: hypothetical protein GC158_00590 [Cyanobacteria bacterium RI_101]|nr:hypothetical protein [Cyanobacteria bacterium RI_101]
MIFHTYLSLSKWKIYSRLVRDFAISNVEIVLDLEDSVGDPFSEAKTIKLKAMARTGLRSLSESEVFKSLYHKNLIRINAVNSPYFFDDISILQELVNNKTLKPKIILPKIESVEHVDIVSSCFLGCEDFEVIPMIETKSAFENLEEILRSLGDYIQKGIVKSLYWGYFDYALDCWQFPFFEYDDEDYWNLLHSFQASLVPYHLAFCAPIFPYFSEEILCGVKKRFSVFNNVIMSSLGTRQTNILLKENINTDYFSLKKYQLSLEEKVNRAKEIIDGFEASRRLGSDRSFALTQAGRFISPHEYKSAVNFLKEI